MPDGEKEAIIGEFETVRQRYRDLLGKMIELGVPGVIDIHAVQCDAGTRCHGGGDAQKIDKVILPSLSRERRNPKDV